MIFQWHHVNNINPNITLDQFEETVIFQKEYATDYYEIQYPGLILNIILNRKVNYHLINSYIPSCLFVTVAWLSLFVNPEAIPGRISMVMMTLLTLMAMFSGIRQSTPKVSSVHISDHTHYSMTQLLLHTFAHLTGPSFRLKAKLLPIRIFLGLM